METTIQGLGCWVLGFVQKVACTLYDTGPTFFKVHATFKALDNTVERRIRLSDWISERHMSYSLNS